MTGKDANYPGFSGNPEIVYLLSQEEARGDEKGTPLPAVRAQFAAAEQFQKAGKGYILSHRISEACLSPSPELSLTRANTWEGRA